MRNLKKVIALVAVFAMMISTVAFAQTFSDVKPEDNYYEAIETLNKLGILTGDDNDGDGVYDFRPNDTITRAEVAVIVARIQGNTGSVAQTATVFNDVPSSNWASGYIAMASNQGIVIGYGDGNFGPEDPVKYEEVIKMLMETLGYKPFADANGGYPTGYLAAAQRADLLSGVNGGSVGQAAPRGLVAQLTYNAIDTPLMDRAVFGPNAEYIIYDGTNGYDRRTLMSQYLKVSKLNGIVTENILSSLTGANAIDTSAEETVTVEILDNYDDEQYYEIGEARTFKVGQTDARNYLGYNVVFYVQQDRTVDDATILSMTYTSGKNQSTSFTLDQYEGFEYAANSNNASYLKYLKNSSDRTASKLTIEENATVIYNNVAYTEGLEDMFGNGANDKALIYPDGAMSGKVTVVDTDNVSGYDVVFVEIATSGVVEEVSERGELTFKNEVGSTSYYNSVKKVIFDDDTDDTIVNITKDGVAYDYNKLAAWDVVTIITRDDISGYYYDIKVLGDSKVEGTVRSVSSSSTSATGSAYEIEGTKYDVAEGYYANGTLKAGTYGTFYIDEYGKIVAYNKEISGSTNERYAYVLNTNALPDEWGNSDATFLLLDKDGSYNYYKLNTTVTVENPTADLQPLLNGVDPQNPTSGTFQPSKLDNVELTEIVNAFVGQLVTYNTVSDGRIRTITLPDTKDINEGTLRQEKVGKSEYNERSMTLGGQDLDENTIVFYINSELENDDIALGDAASKDYSEVGTIADLSDGEAYSYALYDADDFTGMIKVAVLFNAELGGSASKGIVVIDSVGDSVVDDYDVTSVEYYDESGELQVATTDPDLRNADELANAKQGEVFKLNVVDGVITSARAYLTFNGDSVRTDIRRGGDYDIPSVATMAKSNSDDEEVFFGALADYKKTNKRITLAPLEGGIPDLSILDSESISDYQFNLSNVKNVYVYDPSRNSSNRLYMGVVSDLSFDEALLTDGMTVYTDRTNSTVLCETPAYGMLDYVYVRKYDNKVEDVVIYKSFDYGRYSVN